MNRSALFAVPTETESPAVAAAPKKEKREHGTGSLNKIEGSPYWYIWYSADGKQRRESTKTTDKKKARAILIKRLAAIDKGETLDYRRMRYEDLRAVLIADYKAKGKLVKVVQPDGKVFETGRKQIFAPLDAFFSKMKVSNITTDTLRKFVAARKAEGVSGPTANRNLALLRRMFSLAMREGKLQHKPHFPMQEESPARQGFVKQAEFEQLREALPGHLRPLVTFLYESGCRWGAATQVIWPWVNLEEGTIDFPPGVTKNKAALTLPLSGELVAMLKTLPSTPGNPVFDAENFRKEWEKACVAIGKGEIVAMKTPVKNPKQGEKQWHYWGKYKGLLPHDLRRSAVRNMVRAGVDQATAMSISGHKTISTFLRYNVVDVQDRKAAMLKVVEAGKLEMERSKGRK